MGLFNSLQMKFILYLVFTFFNLSIYSQNINIPLLNNFEYKLNSKLWEIDEMATLDVPYHTEYVLKSKLKNIAYNLRIGVMDYYLKDSIYSNLDITRKTAFEELEMLKLEMMKSEDENVKIEFSDYSNFKGYKILIVKLSAYQKEIYFVIGAKVIDEYIVVGISVENITGLNLKVSESILKKHLKRLSN